MNSPEKNGAGNHPNKRRKVAIGECERWPNDWSGSCNRSKMVRKEDVGFGR